MSKYNETIVFVVRETGWTLEYIRSIPLDQFWALVKELRYQKDLEEYHRDRLLAMLVAPQYKDTTALDLLGEMPRRDSDREAEKEIWLLAIEKGIRIPSKR